MDFHLLKLSALRKVDLSKKGSIDDGCREVVDLVNNSDCYFTTSSCSGRLSIFSIDKDADKRSCHWHYVTHDNIDKAKCSFIVSNEGLVQRLTLKVEPFILHIQCKDLESAQKLLIVALQSGYKNSGLTISKRQNIILAVRSTMAMEVPLTDGYGVMPTAEHLEFILGVAEEKMEENATRAKRLLQNVRQQLPSTTAAAAVT